MDNDQVEMDSTSIRGSDLRDIYKQILDQLKMLNGRIEKVEEKVERQDNRQLLSPRSVHNEGSSSYQKDSELLLPSKRGSMAPEFNPVRFKQILYI